MALLILGMIALGIYMTGLDDEDASRGDLYGLHKSFGALILFLVVLRFITRLRTAVPDLPKVIPARERKLGHATHYLLYVLMLAVPLVGIALSNSWGDPVHMFGLELPRLFPENKDIAPLVGEAHEILAFVLLGVVGLHVAGVIKHILFEKTNLLTRMLPSKSAK